MADVGKSEKRSRRSIRLREYDYSQPGMYFVTVVTYDRRCLLGQVVDGRAQLSGAGEIVAETLRGRAERFLNVSIDIFVVMPNHIHVVLAIGAQFIAPSATPYGDPGAMNRAPTLGYIIRVLKAVTTHRIHKAGNPNFSWQRNYYEHVIRNDESLTRIRQYILDNPLKWELDPENPDATNPEPPDTWHVT